MFARFFQPLLTFLFVTATLLFSSTGVSAQDFSQLDTRLVLEEVRQDEQFKNLSVGQQEQVESAVFDTVFGTERPDAERIRVIGSSPCTGVAEYDISALPAGITNISISKFPPVSGEEVIVSVCIRTSEPHYSYEDVLLSLVLEDGRGNLLHESSYDGDVVAIPLSVRASLALDKIPHSLVLKAELQKDGNMIDRREKTYSCEDTGSCDNSLSGTFGAIWSSVSSPVVLLVIALLPIIALVLLLLSRVSRKRGKRQIFLFAFILAGTSLMIAHSADADCTYYTDSDTGNPCMECSGPVEPIEDGCTFQSQCCGSGCFTGGTYGDYGGGYYSVSCPCPDGQLGSIMWMNVLGTYMEFNFCYDPPVWSDWSSCTVPCGGGTQTRTCTTSMFMGNELWCTMLDGTAGTTETRACNTEPCSSPENLEVCEQNPSSSIWTPHSNDFALSTLTKGGTVNMRAFFDDTSGDCAGTDVTSDSDTAWDEVSDPDNAFTVNVGSVSSDDLSGNIADGSMRVSHGGQGIDIYLPGYCSWTASCSDSESKYCQGETFSITDPNCSGTRTCTGTKNCNFNFREVAPGE